jgi:hypothetical protein
MSKPPIKKRAPKLNQVNEAMKTVVLEIDEMRFQMAFGRDADYHDTCPQSHYLDLVSGDFVFAYDHDDDATEISPDENCRTRILVAANPNRYLKIPGLSSRVSRIY